MTDESSKMYYRDIITPDDSIDRLIETLSRLNTTYQGAMKAITDTGVQMKAMLDSVTGSASASQTAIAKMTGTVEQLRTTSANLRTSMASVMTTTEKLKTIQQDNATVTKQQAAFNKSAASSYDAMQAELKETIELYKALTAEERADSQMGQALLQTISNLTSHLSRLDAEISTTNTSTSELVRAKQRLANLMSAEGMEAQKLRNQINNMNAVVREQSRLEKELITSEERLRQARSAANQTLQQYKKDISDANRLAKLNATIASSAAGSYNQLAATYEKLKMEVNALSEEERKAAAGQEMVNHLKAIYVQMIRLQEETGNHRLSVGNYSKVWNSFGYSVAQVVRELPSMAMGINTFILAISNNLPILADEIARVRQENAALRAQGQPTVSVMKQIKNALLSWNTGLVLVITVLTLFGQELLDWIKNARQFRGEVISSADALKNIVNAISESNDSYASNRTQLQLLANEWKNLNTEADRADWIEKNANAFESLGLAITDTNTAEEVFVKNTANIIKSFQARAMAAAAQKLAEEEYLEALKAGAKADELRYGDAENMLQASNIQFEMQRLQTDLDKARAEGNEEAVTEIESQIQEAQAKLMALQANADVWDWTLSALTSFYPIEGVTFDEAGNIVSGGYETPQQIRERRINTKDLQAQGHEASGDYMASLFARFKDLEKALLGDLAIDTDITGGGGGTGQRDITEQIYQRRLQVAQDYNDTLAGLEADEDERRNREELTRAENQILALQELYRKNELWLENNGDKGTKKFKELTDEQVGIINQMQVDIQKAITNIQNRVGLNATTDEGRDITDRVNRAIRKSNIAYNRAVAEGQEDPFDERRARVVASAEKEYAELSDLYDKIEEYINDPKDLYQDLSPEQLEATVKAQENLSDTMVKIKQNEAYQINKINNEEQIDALNTLNRGIKMQHDAMVKGSEESLQLALQMNKNNRKIALLQNANKPASQQISNETINQSYDYQTNVIITEYRVEGLERTLQAVQDYNNAVYGDTGYARRQNYKAEQEYWDGIIKLYETGTSTITEMEYKTAQARSKNAKRQAGFSGIMSDIGQQGLLGGLLTNIPAKWMGEGKGFSSEGLDALNNGFQTAISYLNEYMQARVEMAELEAELAEEEHERAQERVDDMYELYKIELELRANGYANAVDTARLELDQARQNEQLKAQAAEEAQARVAEAEKQQEAANTAMQVSSLITASAQIIAAYAGFPIVGQILAATAIAGMWATFIAAKAMAAQVTSTPYGEGGLEFLEGGSHASGHDIPLGTTNSEGKQMRAEGGEALAIINKQKTAKYRKILPDLVDSLNKGTFEDKYLNAFATTSAVYTAVIEAGYAPTDTTKLESLLQAIREQGSVKQYVLPNGTTVTQKGNVRRIIRRS